MSNEPMTTGDEPSLGSDKQLTREPVVSTRPMSGSEPALGRDAMLTHLESILNHHNTFLREQAIMAAWRLGQITTPCLIDLVEDQKTEPEIRQLAVWAIALNTDLRAIPILSDALRSPDQRVRRYAMEGLARLRNPAVPVLIEALREEGDPAELAVEALRRIGPIAVSALIETLDDPEAHVRGLAADALGRIGAIRALPGLLRALDDEHAIVRENAIEALGLLNQPAAVEPLIGCLHDPDENIQRTASQALRRIGTQKALRALTRRGLEALRISLPFGPQGNRE